MLKVAPVGILKSPPYMPARGSPHPPSHWNKTEVKQNAKDQQTQTHKTLSSLLHFLAKSF